jgi:hypothetical protein
LRDPNTDWGAVDPTQQNVPGYFNLMPGEKYLDLVESSRNNNWHLLTEGIFPTDQCDQLRTYFDSSQFARTDRIQRRRSPVSTFSRQSSNTSAADSNRVKLLFMRNVDPTGCVLGLAGGLLGVVAVMLGAVLEVPGFCPHDGYVGTEYLSSFLYALGNDLIALIIVSAIWFVYMAIPFAAIGGVVSLLRKRRDVP